MNAGFRRARKDNMKIQSTICMAIAMVTLCGCDSTGTCEFKFDEASGDNSIPQGLEVCQPEWVAERCNGGSMDQVNQGLKTSGYKFTKGAKCQDRGYKDCSGGRGFAYYKACPGK